IHEIHIVIYLIILTYWDLATMSFYSQYSLTKHLIQHAKTVFDNEEIFSLHRFQERLLRIATESSDSSIEASDEETTKRKRIALKTTSSHYSFRNLATKLIRQTRGLTIAFVALASEALAILIMFSTTLGASTSADSVLSVITIIVIFELFFISMLALVEYIELEFAVHGTLDYSKRNLIALYDLVLMRIGMSHTIQERDSKILTDDFQLSQEFFDYSNKLPTWTFDSRIALSIGGGVAIQAIVLIIGIINALMTHTSG
ncbi:unnamed protein product, partial [marine sediment metagenome]